MRVFTVVLMTLVLCLAAAPLALPTTPRPSWGSPVVSGIAFGVALLAALWGLALLVRARRRPRTEQVLAGPPPISQPFPQPVPQAFSGPYPARPQGPRIGARSVIGESHIQTQAGRAMPSDDGYVTVRTRW